jgi:hypothetical protein
MLILVEIDLSHADLALFDAYEARALGLLAQHGARLEERLRSVDQLRETHLLHFPDNEALEAFRADPARAALQDSWLQCGARSALSEVLRIPADRPTDQHRG